MENNQQPEKEVAGGIEFSNELPVETPKEEIITPAPEPTETAGGVTFTKTEEEKKEEPSTPKPKRDDDTLHTMAEDMGEEVEQKQGAALQTILQQEREAREKRKQQQKNLVFALVSIVFFVAAIGVFIYATRPIETVEPAKEVVRPSLIYAENHVRVNVTDIQPLTLISNIKQRIAFGDTNQGELTNIYFTEDLPNGALQTQNTRQFFSAIQSSVPGTLLPLLDKDFMLGVFSSDTRKPFLVLETLSSAGYAQMKNWESTLLQEMSRVFGLTITDPNLYSKEFSDYEFSNKQMRAVFTEEGEFVLGYTFLDERYIVIVSEEVTLEELLQRLAARF
jgi:hypothetical protein